MLMIISNIRLPKQKVRLLLGIVPVLISMFRTKKTSVLVLGKDGTSHIKSYNNDIVTCKQSDEDPKVVVTYKVVKPHTTKVACFPLSANTRIASLGGGDYISTIQPELRILMTLRT